MGKKGGAGGGGAGGGVRKSAAPVASNALDDDCVVFGYNNKKKGPSAPAPTHSSVAKQRGPGPRPNLFPSDGKLSAEDEKKQAELKTNPLHYDLTNWTGKTPIALLSELTQKKKWHKPRYITKNKPGGTIVVVVLEKKDKKGVLHKVDYCADIPCPTAADAKLRTSVMALHGVQSHLSMKMMIAPALRGYWSELDVTHKEKHKLTVPGDPFERTAPKTAEFQKKMEALKLNPAPQAPTQATDAADAPHKPKRVELEKRIVEVHMSEAVRTYVEEVIRTTPLDIESDESEDDSSVAAMFAETNATEKAHALRHKALMEMRMVQNVVKMGFREAHVQEALQFSKTKQEILNWLCVHVPEDDLPVKWRPMKYDAISMGTQTSESLSIKLALDRLSTIGFERSLCESMLQQCAGNEAKALRTLMEQLVSSGRDDSEPIPAREDFTDEERHEMNQIEIETLRDQFGEALDVTTDNKSLTITFNADWDEYNSLNDTHTSRASGYGRERGRGRGRGRGGSAKGKGNVNAGKKRGLQLANVPGTTVVEVMFEDVSYPVETPMIILRNSKLPAYIRLGAMQAIGVFAASLVNSPIVYALVGWIEMELPELIASPPPLSSMLNQSKPDGSLNGSSRPQKEQNYHRDVEQSSSTKRRGESRFAPRKAIANRVSKKMMDTRERLPAFKFRQQIIEVIRSEQVVIVAGDTGCGKTTQVPQFILDLIGDVDPTRPCNVVCTQPRRLSATAVASRVANERGEQVGETVGYSIRLENKRCAETRLLFCTTGILLRRLLTDRKLANVTHVLVDEVHERSLDSDILLVILKEVLRHRPDFRLILMSATIDSAKFSAYFNGAKCVTIPGRTMPVTRYDLDDILNSIPWDYIPESSMRKPKKIGKGKSGSNPLDDFEYDDEQSVYADSSHRTTSIKAVLYNNDVLVTIDYDLIAAVVRFIVETKEDGAILIFMPGMAEIKTLCNILNSTRCKGHRLLVLPLHSTLSTEQQQIIFERPPQGVRKVVVSTNIAETSITVDDVVHVIDTGRVKEMGFDATNNMSVLQDQWASRNSSKQRMGRAGRVTEGYYYAMFSRKRWSQMKQQSDPEILCLSIKAMGIFDVNSFLKKTITPPDTKNIEAALKILSNIGAIDQEEELTPLGQHIVGIPVDVRIAKLLVYGAIFGCADPILTVGAVLSSRSPFLSPLDKRDEANAAKNAFSLAKSDHLTYLRAYDSWRNIRKNLNGREERAWADENFLSLATLNIIHSTKKQYLNALIDAGFVDRKMSMGNTDMLGSDVAEHARNIKVLKALLVAGLYPNIVRIAHPKDTYHSVGSGTILKENNAKDLRFFDHTHSRVFVHPSSVNFSTTRYEAPFGVYHEKVQTSKVFLRDLTMVNAFALLLFGGGVIVEHALNRITIDGWIVMDVPARVGVLFSELRRRLDESLKNKLKNPRVDIVKSPVVQAMKMVLMDTA
eukprot:CFRG7272T1